MKITVKILIDNPELCITVWLWFTSLWIKSNSSDGIIMNSNGDKSYAILIAFSVISIMNYDHSVMIGAGNSMRRRRVCAPLRTHERRHATLRIIVNKDDFYSFGHDSWRPSITAVSSGLSTCCWRSTARRCQPHFRQKAEGRSAGLSWFSPVAIWFGACLRFYPHRVQLHWPMTHRVFTEFLPDLIIFYRPKRKIVCYFLSISDLPAIYLLKSNFPLPLFDFTGLDLSFVNGVTRF